MRISMVRWKLNKRKEKMQRKVFMQSKSHSFRVVFSPKRTIPGKSARASNSSTIAKADADDSVGTSSGTTCRDVRGGTFVGAVQPPSAPFSAGGRPMSPNIGQQQEDIRVLPTSPPTAVLQPNVGGKETRGHAPNMRPAQHRAGQVDPSSVNV